MYCDHSAPEIYTEVDKQNDEQDSVMIKDIKIMHDQFWSAWDTIGCHYDMILHDIAYNAAVTERDQ